MTTEKENIIIPLEGRVDSNNVGALEEEIMSQLEGHEKASVVLDFEKLEYISSAGLRLLLRIKKKYDDLTIINVNSDVYEVLEMTGFTEMMEISKAYRVVSIEGCEEIGRGVKGTIYRIDNDNVVKVYNNPNSLNEIKKEREMAKLALVLGLPTAISYDVVRVGDSYGSVFELLNARSFAKILAEEPEKLDWCAKEFSDLLVKINSTVVPEGKLPSIKERAFMWANFTKEYLPEDKGEKLLKMIEEIPEDNHMVHGDYHTKNVELQGDEVLIIDMDTLAVGHPIFDLAGTFNACLGFHETDHSKILSFQGYDWETSQKLWRKTLENYLCTTDEKRIREVEDKIKVIGYTRLVRHAVRYEGLDSEEGKQEFELWRQELLELLDRVDSLLFDPNELIIEAVEENLPTLTYFIEHKLEEMDCSHKEMMQILLASEEIFINIASYAYQPDKGAAIVKVETIADPVTVNITFVDQGVPYDPLSAEDPIITGPASERDIGGLGVFLAKQVMDDVSYEYRDGSNILKLKKNIK